MNAKMRLLLPPLSESALTIWLFRLFPRCITFAPATDHVACHRTVGMDMPRTEDSIDITTTFAALNTLSASRRRLAGALCRHDGDLGIREYAPATVALRAGMTNRLALNAL
jgi:hypothetical protein